VKATKEQSPIHCPKSGSTKRLADYEKRLKSDALGRVFDGPVMKVFKNYVKASKLDMVNGELRYLKNLKDPDGIPFSRSVGFYSQVETQVGYFTRQDPASFAWNENFQAAVKTVASRYPKGLHMLEYHNNKDIYDAVTDWSTSAGYIGIVTGFRKKRDYLATIFDDLMAEEDQAIKDGRYTRPLAQASRTQGGGAYDKRTGKRTGTCTHKRRDVQNNDVFSNATECRVGVPLTNFLKLYSYTAIGKDDNAITELVWHLRMHSQGFLSLDYSKYDSTIPGWLLRYAFKVLRSCFSFRNRHEKALFDVIEETFIIKSFALPGGNVLVTHGTPSGSRLTAIINGIVNEIMTETWLRALGVEAKYIIMGDDNLIALEWNGDKQKLLEDVSSYIKHNFGVIVNVEKSGVFDKGEDPEFLSRFWSIEGPWRWVGEVLSLMAYPERYRPYNKGQLTPELVLLSYVLGYRRTMRQIMDVDRFLRENRFDLIKAASSLEARKEMPWNVRNFLESNPKVRKYIKRREALKAA
jgi:hypothetical protein